MESLLSNIKLETWYKSGLIISAACLLASLASSNSEFAIIALGACIHCLGQWINHPTISQFVPGSFSFPSGILSISPRHPSAAGITLEIVGVLLFCAGIIKILI